VLWRHYELSTPVTLKSANGAVAMTLALWWADDNDSGNDHIAMSLHWADDGIDEGIGYADYLATGLTNSNSEIFTKQDLEDFCRAIGIGQDEVVWGVEDAG
jgi:hypothetical protein